MILSPTMRLRVWSLTLVSLAFPTLPAFAGTAEQSQLLQAQQLSNQGELAQVVRVLEPLVHSEPNALDDDSRAALVLVEQTVGRNTPLYAAAELTYARLLRATGANTEATQKETEARAALDGIRRRLQRVFHQCSELEVNECLGEIRGSDVCCRSTEGVEGEINR